MRIGFITPSIHSDLVGIVMGKEKDGYLIKFDEDSHYFFEGTEYAYSKLDLSKYVGKKVRISTDGKTITIKRIKTMQEVLLV